MRERAILAARRRAAGSKQRLPEPRQVPQDESLRLHLAALDQLDPDERAGIRALIEGALLRHQARRFAQTS